MIIQILIGIIVIVVLFKLFHKFWFLRDPERIIPKAQNIVSPADGKVIDILDTSKPNIIIKKHFGKIKTLIKDISPKCKIVSIFMNPFNVHINRAPIEGVITSVNYKKGKLLPVTTFEKGLLNEKNEIMIKNNKIKIKVIQIAGILARRIECFVKKGQKLNKGQRIGLINLGSQLVVIMPSKVKIKVKKGEKVKAGSSILGEY
jgi:phosphatidylserine decarboxylase